MVSAGQFETVQDGFPGPRLGDRATEEPVVRKERCLRQLFDHAADGIFERGLVKI